MMLKFFTSWNGAIDRTCNSVVNLSLPVIKMFIWLLEFALDP